MQAVAETATKTHHPGDRTLMWIAAYNFGKGLLLLTIALGLLGFLHKDVDTIVGHWISALGVSLENEHVAALLKRLDVVTDNQLKFFSGITFVFAAVFVVEGVGLFYRKRWAEYLTVVVTSSFVPFELFETIKRFGTPKFVLLTVNVVIVCCLLWILKKNPKHKPACELANQFATGTGNAPMVALAANVAPAAVGQKVSGSS
jgi:uncharacterized membrane protein (DUF2068 family)